MKETSEASEGPSSTCTNFGKGWQRGLERISIEEQQQQQYNNKNNYYDDYYYDYYDDYYDDDDYSY